MVNWKLSTVDRTIAQGTFPEQDIKSSGLKKVGSIQIPLSEIRKATKCQLVVSINTRSASIANDWDVWVYPSQLSSSGSEDLLIVSEQNNKAKSRLRSGGKVALFLSPKQIKTDVALGLSSIFWNTAWTNGQAYSSLAEMELELESRL